MIQPIEPEIVEDATFGTLIYRLSDGRNIYQKPDDAIEVDAFLKAQSAAIVKSGKTTKFDTTLFIKLIATSMCTVDGQPITIDMMNGKPSTNGRKLEWKALGAIQTYINNEMEELMPDPKASLESEESLE